MTADPVVTLVRQEVHGASVSAACEAGYSSFYLRRKLETAGIRCLVVHVSSIEVSHATWLRRISSIRCAAAVSETSPQSK